MKYSLVTLIALFALAVAPVSLFAQAAQAPSASQVPCCPGGTGSSSTTTGSGFVGDISPYAGYVWPQSFSGIGDFKGNQVLGVRGGFFLTSGFQIGGNYYWNNHFQPRRSNTAASFAGDLGFPQGAVRANLWELEFTYNFGKRRLFGSTVRPYVVAGFGGITTRIKNEDTFVLNVRPVTTVISSQSAGVAGLVKEAWADGEPGAIRTVYVANDVLENNDTFFTFSYGGGLKATRLWGPMGVFGDFRGRTVPNFFGHSNTWPELSAGLNFSWGEK